MTIDPRHPDQPPIEDPPPNPADPMQPPPGMPVPIKD